MNRKKQQLKDAFCEIENLKVRLAEERLALEKMMKALKEKKPLQTKKSL